MGLRVKIVVLVFISLAVFCLSPFFGSQTIPFSLLFDMNGSEGMGYIFYQLRVPRVLAGFLTGAALGLAGMVFQAIFRNELATPYTLGIASGASLGAAFSVQAGISFVLFSFPATAFFAFVGALLTTFIVYILSKVRNGRLNIVLIGIALSYFASSLLMLVQYWSDPTASYRIVRWLMGSLESMRLADCALLLPVCLIGSLSIYILHPELDLLACGDDIAVTRGLSLYKVRRVFFLITSILVGVIVALCGPLGFVGLVAPHVARIFVGARHKYLAIASFCIGGSFLVCCDMFSRVLIAPAEMPVGILTSLLGAPFFLLLLFKKQ